MKVALVHDWMNGMGGGEKILEILCDMFPYAPIYTLFYEPSRVSDKLRSKKIIPSALQRFPLILESYLLYLPLFPWAIERFDFSEFDYIISTSHTVAKGVKISRQTKHISYCFTPMRYMWDKFNLHFGHKRSFSPMRMAMKTFRKRMQKWDVKSSENVDHFLTLSEESAEKIKKYYNRESTIIPPPVDTEFFYPALTETKSEFGDTIVGDFYLIASDLLAHKRVDIAIKAFENQKDRLLIVGTGPEERRLQSMAPENVTLLGGISDKEILWLYQNCKALIITSEDEYGIMPLEAMSCGRPVIALGRGSILDTVIPEKTGIFYFYQTCESLTNALNKFDKTEFDLHKIHEHTTQYSNQVWFRKMKQFLTEEADMII
jgi:glycosyltransferase involved in cell wall biosynthesis